MILSIVNLILSVIVLIVILKVKNKLEFIEGLIKNREEEIKEEEEEEEAVDIDVKESILGNKEKTLEYYMDLVEKELDEEDNIRIVVMDVLVRESSIQDLYESYRNGSGSGKRGRRYLNKKRLFITHDSYEELSYKIIDNKESFVSKTPYIEYSHIEKAFSNFSHDHKWCERYTDGLKMLIKETLSDHYVGILDR